MAPACDLPCDGDGVCMVCKAAPPETEVVVCRTCATPWHAPCLARPPETLATVADWQCPDCSPSAVASTPAHLPAARSGASGDLIVSIRAIEADTSLTEKEKARRRQALVGGGTALAVDEEKGKKRKVEREDDVLDLFDEKFKCAFCMQLPERPVTKCRDHIPASVASQPRINSALVVAIRMAKTTKSASMGNVAHVYHFVCNENRPEKAFTTERAKRSGKANACSGQIFVTVPPDHFGPILSEHDPKRNKGVLVGELWEDRMECRQWGAHLPHVAGIAGQSEHGAQSVALSGGYEDDEDHGDWFLYTGSGGRDLSGNKRTNKDQSFDQKFEKLNKALRVSCLKGYPVRVVRFFDTMYLVSCFERSHKEKRSSYAPESGVRYDGIYRIEKCWRKVGVQGFKVCRYLFLRCDNEPAPWTRKNMAGDGPSPHHKAKSVHLLENQKKREEAKRISMVNRELMDLIESLQQKTADENVESSEEGSAVVDKSEEGNNSGNERLSNYGRDSVDDKVNKEQIGGLEGKRPTEQQSDDLAMKQLESVDGDSEVNAVNSEEAGEGSPSYTRRTANQSSRKRKKTDAPKRAVKKAKKGEVSNAVEAQSSNGEDSTKTMINHFNVINNVVRRSPRLSKR
ncbi:hypothetical protein COCNU_scaffold001173G000010 [Cocos nucifera]|nr:hypothetical protein [Cocos nucifera]